jgi:hypothetical protein
VETLLFPSVVLFDVSVCAVLFGGCVGWLCPLTVVDLCWCFAFAHNGRALSSPVENLRAIVAQSRLSSMPPWLKAALKNDTLAESTFEPQKDARALRLQQVSAALCAALHANDLEALESTLSEVRAQPNGNDELALALQQESGELCSVVSLCIRLRSLAALEMVLATGAVNASCRTVHGFNLAHLLAQYDHDGEALVRFRAALPADDLVQMMGFLSHSGETPLHVAARKRNLPFLSTVLSLGLPPSTLLALDPAGKHAFDIFSTSCIPSPTLHNTVHAPQGMCVCVCVCVCMCVYVTLCVVFSFFFLRERVYLCEWKVFDWDRVGFGVRTNLLFLLLTHLHPSFSCWCVCDHCACAVQKTFTFPLLRVS